MKIELPRRHRKNFETIANKKIGESLNEGECLEVFNKIKKEYEKAPNSFGSVEGKKESALELLIIISNQIAKEYKNLDVKLIQGIPELTKSKSE